MWRCGGFPVDDVVSCHAMRAGAAAERRCEAAAGVVRPVPAGAAAQPGGDLRGVCGFEGPGAGPRWPCLCTRCRPVSRPLDLFQALLMRSPGMHSQGRWTQFKISQVNLLYRVQSYRCINSTHQVCAAFSPNNDPLRASRRQPQDLGYTQSRFLG